MPYRRVRPSLAVTCLTALIATGSAVAPAVADTIATGPGAGLVPTSDVVIPLRQLTGLDVPNVHLPGLIRHPIGTVGNPNGQEMTAVGQLDVSAVHTRPRPTDPAETSQPDGGSSIISRTRWGAGNPPPQCTENTEPFRASGVHLENTPREGEGNYGIPDSPALSDGIDHALYDHRTRTLHRCDIGYNAPMDKYGRIFAGRAGGSNRSPRTAQTGYPRPADLDTGPLAANRIGPNLVIALARLLAGTSPAPASAAAEVSATIPTAAAFIDDNNGDMVSITGKLLEQLVELGVPGGTLQNFRNGSLILNQAGGLATTILKTFNDSYNHAYNSN